MRKTPFQPKQRKPVRKTSTRQQRINRELRKIKLSIPNVCCICGKHTDSGDLMHLLPRSLYPEYITEEWNLAIGCRTCHEQYDNDIHFRQKQHHIIARLASHDQRAVNRYFKLNDPCK